MSTSIGESLLHAGLLYPLPGAPSNLTTAFAQADSFVVRSLCRLSPPWPTHTIATESHPWSFPSGVEVQYSREDYKVSDRSCFCAASHVIVWESREEDTGQRAFIYSHSPHLQATPLLKGDPLFVYLGESPSQLRSCCSCHNNLSTRSV